MDAINASSTVRWIALSLGVYLVYRLLQVGKRDPRMPPGPPTIPILGNAHQVPATGLYRQFREWAKVYGPVYSLKFGPANVVVLADRKSVHDLLDKKGHIYSDRPNLYVGDLLTKGDMISITHYGSLWRIKRKVVSHNFSPKQLDEKHYRVQEAEATVLLNQLLEEPNGFFNHVRRYTASVISSLVFGQRGATFDSFWAYAVYDVMDRWTETMEPGANPPVDEFPFLQWIPKRFAFWKRRALAAGDCMTGTWEKAREIVDKRRKAGIRRDCIADTLLDEYEKNGFPMSQHGFNNLLGETEEGAADTTSAQLLTLILAFATHPEVQKEARIEIDRLCGTERAPLWSDFDKLPYINCIIKEGMRWRPTAVTSLPHSLMEDDVYEGMFIPKGTTVFQATWAIHHQDGIYDDCEAFNPSRYKDHHKLANDYAGSSDYQARDHYGYGAGRRICPGMHLAERNMWRITAKLLWAFEFSEPIDPKTGQVKKLDTEAYNAGILQAPLPFDVTIKPRSEAHVQTIRKELAGALDFLKAYD